MTFDNFCDLVGISKKRLYNYSRYSGSVSASIRCKKYSELPPAIQNSIQQIKYNLICIMQNDIEFESGLKGSSFKIDGQDFLQNIIQVDDRKKRKIKKEHINALLSIINTFMDG